MSTISRKTFLKHVLSGTAGTMALSTFPGLLTRGMSKAKDRKLGIALVGLGSYSTHQLAPALQQTEHCKLAGIVTGTPAKAKVWARKYDIPEKNIYNYQTMGEMADNDDIDIAYIVLPNVMHADYSIKAAEAGKHVICEKPFTTTVPDAQRVIDACNKNNRKLSIGYRLHFDPFNKEMMRYGQNEVYGKVEELNAGFGFKMNNPYQWRLDEYMAGGGSLMDLGSYPVQGMVYTMGMLPEWIEAEIIPNNNPMFHEVENEIKFTFHFPGGAIGKGKCSYSADPMYSYLNASAEQGKFGLDPSYNYGGLKGFTPDGGFDAKNVNQQARQMDDFALRVKNDTKTPVPGEMGHRDMSLLMTIYDAAETGRAIKVDSAYKALDLVAE